MATMSAFVVGAAVLEAGAGDAVGPLSFWHDVAAVRR
jgi:hypothetical protein